MLAEVSSGAELRLSRPCTNLCRVSAFGFTWEASSPHYKSGARELQDTAGSAAPPSAVISPGAAAPESGENSLLLSLFETDQKQKTILYLKPMI